MATSDSHIPAAGQMMWVNPEVGTVILTHIVILGNWVDFVLSRCESPTCFRSTFPLSGHVSSSSADTSSSSFDARSRRALKGCVGG